MAPGHEDNSILPQCEVTFKGIGRDLAEIKQTTQHLLWWIIGLLTCLAGGSCVALIAAILQKGT